MYNKFNVAGILKIASPNQYCQRNSRKPLEGANNNSHLSETVQQMNAHCSCLHSSNQRDTPKSHDVTRPRDVAAVKVHAQVCRALDLWIKSYVKGAMLAKHSVDAGAARHAAAARY